MKFGNQQQSVWNKAIINEAHTNVQRLVLNGRTYKYMETGNNLKSIVYMTINTVNNKIYIGVHITENPYKFDNYWGCGITGTSSYHFKHPKTPFQRACKKYGLNVFKRYTLFVYETYEEALEMEKQIVTEAFLKRSDVYNVALGGGSGLIPSEEIEVHQYDNTGKYLKTYRSKQDAARKNNTNTQSIIYATKNKSLHLNCFWLEYKTEQLDLNNCKISNKKSIYVYDLNGYYVEEYESISDFAKKHDVTAGVVKRAINNQNKCANKYISFEKVDKIEILTKKRIRDKKIYQYDLNGNFLKEYPNCSFVKDICGKNYKILHSAIKEHFSCGGYLWSFEKRERIEALQKTAKRKIYQYDLNGNLIKIWDSYRDCVKEFSNLRFVLNGIRSQTKGYTFKYEKSS